jgi:hypothetical protein
MGFRFRHSVKVLPGIRLNFGKRGISTSIGVRGAHVTFGKTGTRTTVGLPGSGISYTHLEKPHQARSAPLPTPSTDATPGEPRRAILWVVLVFVVLFSAVLSYLATS